MVIRWIPLNARVIKADLNLSKKFASVITHKYILKNNHIYSQMVELDDKSFLYFEDITGKYDDPSGWITVGRFDDDGIRDSRCVFSALASNNSGTLTHLFSKHGWDVRFEFGHPYFSGQDDIEFNLGNKLSDSDSAIESFIIYRSFHGLFPDIFEPVQNFILYHELIYDDKSKSYIKPISTEPVIRYFNPKYIQVRTGYLKDYLAARNMILVRFHDHERQVNLSIKEIIGKENDSLGIRGNLHSYKIGVYPDVCIPKQKTFSKLLGKDIIKPHDEPRHRDYLFLTGKDKKYTSFIYKIDDDGDPVKASCNVENDTSGFLRPVYFKKDVLQKYYDNQKTYKVSDGVLYHLDLWYIPYGQNEHDLIVVWLGDLANLPYEEQLHWKQHNITPQGSISRTFYQRQIMAECAESNDPVHQIKYLREQINKKFQPAYGFPLFRQLSADDRHVLNALHSLITNEQKEFDEQILYLAKGFIDSLDKKSIISKTTWKPKLQNEDTVLNYFEHFLVENTDLGEDEVSEIVRIFKIIQKIRSTSSAHTKSTKYEKILQKTNLDTFEPKRRFLEITYVFSKCLKKLDQNI